MTARDRRASTDDILDAWTPIETGRTVAALPQSRERQVYVIKEDEVVKEVVGGTWKVTGIFRVDRFLA